MLQPTGIAAASQIIANQNLVEIPPKTVSTTIKI